MNRRQVILVTGASIGLGLAISRRLIHEQTKELSRKKRAFDTDSRLHLVLTSRDGSLGRFDEQGIAEQDGIWIRSLDVTDPEQRQNVVAEIESKLGGVDILINNAGVAFRSCVEHVTESERLNQMNVNFRSPVELIRCVMAGMRSKRRGKIINISSVGGMMAMPTMSVYSASKFALEGASEALYYELRPWNVSVTLIQPGFMRSDAFQKVPYTAMSARATADPDDPYHEHYLHMAQFIETMMNRALASPDSVANKVIKVIQAKSPPLRVYGSIDALIFSILRRMLPRRFYNWFLYRNLPKVREWGTR